MNHEEFLEKIQMGLGPVPMMAARPVLSRLILSKGTKVSLRYEWIKEQKFWDWLHGNPHVDFYDGQEYIEVFTNG